MGETTAGPTTPGPTTSGPTTSGPAPTGPTTRAPGTTGPAAWWPAGRRRAAALAGGVLVAGGLALGFLPLPLASSGCTSAFVGLDLHDPTDVEVLVGCGEQRAERQEVVAVLALLGAAAMTGSGSWARRPGSEDDDPRADGTTTPTPG